MLKIEFIHRITKCAAVAALYTSLSLLLAPISFGEFQIRLPEALSLLPVFGFDYVIAITLGCFASNFLGSSYGLPDIFFGTFSTFLSGVLTYLLRRNKYLAAIPPVVVNAAIVGAVISFSSGTPYYLSSLSIAASQAIVCFMAGIPFESFCRKRNLFSPIRYNRGNGN